MNIRKMNIRLAQNVGRVLMGQKTRPDPFGTIFDNVPCAETMLTLTDVLPVFLGGPIGSPCCYPALVVK